MGKKKGKKSDLDKKAALQAKKEEKAEKSVRKRLQKETKGKTVEKEHERNDATIEAVSALDSLLQHYRQQDVIDTSRAEPVDGFPLPRANATFCLYEGMKKKQFAFLFGGEYYDGVENIVTNHLYRYEIARNEWKRILTPKSPPARCAHSCVHYNHHLYVFGGELATANDYYHYKDLWRYDIQNMNWEELQYPKNSSTSPSARSGHSAAVWKHYMIIFGGFYEAAKDTLSRWYNDVTVLDLQSLQWLEIPHSKLTIRPEPRSACNVAVIDDDVIIHGGFSKLSSKSASVSTSTNGISTPSLPETRVHTDAWRLQLKPLLQNRPPTWERLTSSVQRNQQVATAINTPNGRSGTSAVAYKQRMLVFGGVVDKELHHHVLESVFYNDLFAFDVERKKWFPVIVKQKQTEKQHRRRRREDDEKEEQLDSVIVTEDENDNESDLSDFDENVSNENNNAGWDISKLRSNMFAFLDGNGNLVYEKAAEKDIDSRQSDHDTEYEDEEKEETKECDTKGRFDDASKEQALSHSMRQSSSVIKVHPATKLPDAVSCSEPLPRIKSSLIVTGHLLYIYGGLLEVGDREITLDDLWSLDLRKREWHCIYEGSMHKQIWRGAAFDDDDSYYSREAAGDDSDNDENENENEVGDIDNDIDENANVADQSKEVNTNPMSGQSTESEVPEQVAKLVEQYGLNNENRTPRTGESLAEFYARTSDFWLTEMTNQQAEFKSAKDLKREAFSSARTRFDEIEPILKYLSKLS